MRPASPLTHRRPRRDAAAVRRSAVAVLTLGTLVDDPDGRARIVAFLESLAAPAQLDVGVYVLRTARRFGAPVTFEAGPRSLRRGLPRDVRCTEVRAWLLEPEWLVAGMGLAWVRGPTAARPAALVGLGARPCGTVAASLGRVLGVPAAVLVRDRDAPITAEKDRRWLRWSTLFGADSERVADQLARRGVAAAFEPGPGPEAIYSRLGQRFAECLVQGRGQGAERVTSSA